MASPTAVQAGVSVATASASNLTTCTLAAINGSGATAPTAGNEFLALVEADSSTAPTLTGWTLLSSKTFSTTGFVGLYHRTVTSTDHTNGETVTVINSGTAVKAIALYEIASWSGVDTYDLEDNGGGGQTISLSATASSASDLGLILGGSGLGAAPGSPINMTNPTAPTGFTSDKSAVNHTGSGATAAFVGGAYLFEDASPSTSPTSPTLTYGTVTPEFAGAALVFLAALSTIIKTAAITESSGVGGVKTVQKTSAISESALVIGSKLVDKLAAVATSATVVALKMVQKLGAITESSAVTAVAFVSVHLSAGITTSSTISSLKTILKLGTITESSTIAYQRLFSFFSSIAESSTVSGIKTALKIAPLIAKGSTVNGIKTVLKLGVIAESSTVAYQRLLSFVAAVTQSSVVGMQRLIYKIAGVTTTSTVTATQTANVSVLIFQGRTLTAPQEAYIPGPGPLSATSSHPEVASASISGSMLIVKPTARPGVSTIVVTDNVGHQTKVLAIVSYVTENIQFRIFDKNGNLQDIPSAAITCELHDIINGGSAQGTLVLPRAFMTNLDYTGSTTGIVTGTGAITTGDVITITINGFSAQYEVEVTDTTWTILMASLVTAMNGLMGATFTSAGSVLTIAPAGGAQMTLTATVNTHGKEVLTVSATAVTGNKIDYDYRVQLFLNDSVNPWYDGYVADFVPAANDQKDSEQITVRTEGWQTFAGRAIVTEQLDPSVQNGTMDADTYLIHLLSTYLDSSHFGTSYVPSIPIELDAMTFDGEQLNQCIDDVVKQVQDQSGNLYEWFVRGINGSKPGFVIQPVSNPLKISQFRIAPTVSKVACNFLFDFRDSTTFDDSLENTARNIYNMIALYGTTDPSTGVAVYGAFRDSLSISLYGVRQKLVTDTSIASQLALSNYATSYLLQNGYPQPQRTYERFIPTDALRAGVWVQMFDANDFLNPQGIYQERCTETWISIDQTTGKVTQYAVLTAPLPFLDAAYYGAINAAANASKRISSANPYTQTLAYYVASGFDFGGQTGTEPSLSVYINQGTGVFVVNASGSFIQSGTVFVTGTGTITTGDQIRFTINGVLGTYTVLSTDTTWAILMASLASAMHGLGGTTITHSGSVLTIQPASGTNLTTVMATTKGPGGTEVFTVTGSQYGQNIGVPYPSGYGSASGPGPYGSLLGYWEIAIEDAITGFTGDGYYEIVYALDPATTFGLTPTTPTILCICPGQGANGLNFLLPYDASVLPLYGITVVNGEVQGATDRRTYGGVSSTNLIQATPATVPYQLDLRWTWSATTTSITMWFDGGSSTTPIPIFMPNGNKVVAPPTKQSSPAFAITGLPPNTSFYVLIWYNIASQKFFGLVQTTQFSATQRAQALADGNIPILGDSSNINNAYTPSSGTVSPHTTILSIGQQSGAGVL
jgi:hypothetical protein